MNQTKKILVTGSNGFVGSYVVNQLLEAGYTVYATSLSADVSTFAQYKNYHFLQMDFTNPFEVYDTFHTVQPAAVVHCGAMSRPDDCEINQAKAYDVNVGGTVQLLLHAADYKSHFIYLSSDFIFSGESAMHKKGDRPAPCNYYGRTKMEAEEAVQEYAYNWAIVRIVFAYGKKLYGRDNFVTMIAKKLQAGEPYKIVNDQYRTPTFIEDIAAAIEKVITKNATGIYNICGPDVLTPYQMAMQVSNRLQITDHHFTPVTQKEFTEVARRPVHSSLDTQKAQEQLQWRPTPFAEGLRLTLGNVSGKFY